MRSKQLASFQQTSKNFSRVISSLLYKQLIIKVIKLMTHSQTLLTKTIKFNITLLTNSSIVIAEVVNE